MIIPIYNGGFFRLSSLSTRRLFFTNYSKQFLHISKYFKNYKFKSSRKSEIINGDKIADHARMQESLWKTLVPEKYITFNSSSFFFLAALTLALHQYNAQKEKFKHDEKQ